MQQLNSGFSLIELLIVIAIIGILTGLTYPSYNHYLTTTRRNYATTALTDLAARLEQYYIQNNSYSGATLSSLGMSDINKNYYQLKIDQATDDQYTISANPKGKQAEYDSACGALILDQAGNKSITGRGTSQECWR